jgi:hypothetical protein
MHAYRIWKGVGFDIEGLHPVLASTTSDDNVGMVAAPMGQWQLIETKQPLSKNPATKEKQEKPVGVNDVVKRKHPNKEIAKPRKKRKTIVSALVGIKWDCVNYSCAYDAVEGADGRRVETR